jgi:hypothetical protein
MNQTSASVRAGESSATFPVRLPRWSGEDSLNTPCMTIPKYLVVSQSKPPMIEYSLDYELRLVNPTYPFVLKFPTLASKEAENVGDRLKTHIAELTLFFPLMIAAPTLSYIDFDEDDPHFEVRLPPRSSLVTSSEVFFPALGFFEDDENSEPPEYSTGLIGGRGRKIQSAHVWGFFNSSFTTKRIIRGITMHPGMSMEAMFEDEAEVTIPEEVQLQAELYEINRVFDTRTATLVMRGDNRDEATLSKAVTALEELLEEVRVGCGLHYNMLDVATDGISEITLSNRVYEGAATTVVLTLNDQMATAFNFPLQRNMTFNLAVQRSYTFKITSGIQDPFANKYPVSAIAYGVGDSKSWVEGLGYACIFCVMREREPLISDGVLLSVNQTYLTLQFLDSGRNKIVFANDAQLDLCLKFKRIDT